MEHEASARERHRNTRGRSEAFRFVEDDRLPTSDKREEDTAKVPSSAHITNRYAHVPLRQVLLQQFSFSLHGLPAGAFLLHSPLQQNGDLPLQVRPQAPQLAAVLFGTQILPQQICPLPHAS